MTPPKLAQLLLHLCLPRSIRAQVLEDLAVGFGRRVGRNGMWLARRWYWSQSVRSLAPRVQLRRLRDFAHVRAAVAFDAAYAVRSLRRAPGFTTTVLVILTAGVGVCTALVTVAEHTILRPPPYPEPDRLYLLRESHEAQGIRDERTSPENFLDWRARSESFGGIASWRPMPLIVYGPERGEFVNAARVTRDYFDVLAWDAAVGRVFTDEDFAAAWYDSAEDYIGGGPLRGVISHALWVRQFGSHASVLGTTVGTELGPVEIIGVMPAGFRPPLSIAEIFLPVEFRDDGVGRNSRFIDVIARLRTDRTYDQAVAELDAISTHLAAAYPGPNAGWSIRAFALQEYEVADDRAALAVLFGAVGCLLLIAALNIAGMQLARWTMRARETALRRALGASRLRIGQQLVVENVILFALGGVLGFFGSIPILRVLLAMSPQWDSTVDRATPNPAVFGLAVAVIALIGLVAALIPAFRVSGEHGTMAVSRGGRWAGPGPAVLRRAFIVGEIAVTLVLLVAAGLLARSVLEVQRVDPGFDPSRVAVLRMFLDKDRFGWSSGYGGSPRAYYARLTEHLEDLPFVEAAGGIQALPMLPANTIDFARPYWRPDEIRPGGDSRLADVRLITPGYFDAVGMHMVSGREFDNSDDPTRPEVIIVNESLAKSLFPEETAVGQALMIDYRGVRSVQIVGVVNDVRFYRLSQTARPELYLPHAQVPYRALSVAVRVSTDPRRVLPDLREAVLQLDPLQPVQEALTLDALVERSEAERRAQAWVVGSIAAAAVFLAGTAIYGILAYMVAERRRAIGVRMALGARAQQVGMSVLVESVRLAAAGAVLGLLFCVPLLLAVRAHLFAISAWDARTFATSGLTLFVIAALAGLIPAYRAAQTDPAEIMRTD